MTSSKVLSWANNPASRRSISPSFCSAPRCQRLNRARPRLIQEARNDAELRGWLDWLARSSNARNARMGRWYLRQLEITSAQPDTPIFATPEIERESEGEDDLIVAIGETLIHEIGHYFGLSEEEIEEIEEKYWRGDDV